MSILSKSALLATAVGEVSTAINTKLAKKAGAVFAGPASTAPVTVAFSTTPAFNAALSNVFYLGVMTSAVTGPTFINGTDGQTINVCCEQDGSGGKGFTLPANVKANEAIDTTASRTSWLIITWRASKNRWEGSWSKVPA